MSEPETARERPQQANRHKDYADDDEQPSHIRDMDGGWDFLKSAAGANLVRDTLRHGWAAATQLRAARRQQSQISTCGRIRRALVNH
jgi:hypothetical protein